MKESYDFLLNDVGIKENDTIVMGISGGPDSMALFSLLLKIRKNINIKLVCAHVNHNVRKVSAKEKEFIEDYCEYKNVVFESMVIEQYGDDNFHNEARNIRYNFFHELIKKYNAKYLMTAHHGDDLIETILMRISRGSTLKGYSGFDQIVDMGDYKIVRPLIFYTKKEIEEFDKKKGIPFVIDKSNFKDKYTRNRYRKTVLPFLKKEDINVHRKFLKYSQTLKDYSDYIDRVTNEEIKKVYKDGVLQLDRFIKLDILIQRKVIYSILEEKYGDDLMYVNDKHVDLIMQLISSKKKNSFVYLPNLVKAVKNYNEFYLTDEVENLDSYEIELIDYAVLPNGKHIEVIKETNDNSNNICRLSKSDVKFPLYIRTRKLGDKMVVKGLGGSRKIKDIFIDCKISSKDRELWPVVVDSKGDIVWLPGLKKSKFDVGKTGNCDIIIKYY